MTNAQGTEPSSTRDSGCKPQDQDQDAAETEKNFSWWSAGIAAQVQSLPAGFKHSTILSAGIGINAGLQSWGQKMQKAKRMTRNPDIALSHLSYWTDNGA